MSDDNKLFGDGSDGEVTISSDAELTRSYETLSLLSGVSLVPSGYTIFESGKEAKMTIPDNKPTMQPFRAWVAWHPAKGFELNSIGVYKPAVQRWVEWYNEEFPQAPYHPNGWRIVEVEVREVEK